MIRKTYKPRITLLAIISISLFMSACQNKENAVSYEKDGDIWFRNAGIELKFDEEMYCTVYDLSSGISLNEVRGESRLSSPSHYIVVNGEALKSFRVDYDQIQVEEIENEFGPGTRLVLKGTGSGTGDLSLEKTLTVEMYANYPDVAVTEVSYKNLSASAISLESEFSSSYCLDASLANPESKPYDFWSFQGASIAWGLDYILPISDGFEQENWMGVQNETLTGGGVPLVDLWTPSTGLAIAHLETKPQLLSFPVQVNEDKKVQMAISTQLNKPLAPGETYQSLKTAVMVHTKDFFDPLQTYASLLADLGMDRIESPDEAHEAIWCGWGYLTDFTKEDIFGTLPKLKELGIKWVVIDDRWWDRYGDWNTRDFTFPGGEQEIRQFVDSLHSQGFKVKIWWAPTPVQPEHMLSWGGSVDPGMAQVAREHPEWLIMDKNGEFPRDCRDMYQFCPSVPEVQEYMKELTTRFIRDWDFDGHKLDAYYVVPPCYNPAHNHQRPEESYEDLPLMLKAIYETSNAIKAYSVTEICNCGTTQDFFQSIYSNQPVVSDPTSVEQSRRRVKVIKALWGPEAPAYTDHVEHIRLEVDMNDKSDTARVGQDFATAMGPGGVIGTKFTWPAGPENMQLTGEREKHWQKWFQLYNEKMLSKGSYLNLYDIIYDLPEAHVIQKADTLYYAFYADHWEGELELRGLNRLDYRVYDYVNQKKLDPVKGPVGILNASFDGHLLIECVPLD